jgi:hypothetical protein
MWITWLGQRLIPVALRACNSSEDYAAETPDGMWYTGEMIDEFAVPSLFGAVVFVLVVAVIVVCMVKR